jgi:UDP-glucuronate 4-epimerase
MLRVLDQPAKPNAAWDSAYSDPGSSLAPWRIYNIGNNRPVQLLDYIAALEKALGKKAELDFAPLQPGDVVDTWADVTDLVEQFGYKPATPVEAGVGCFVQWYRNYVGH